MAETLLQATIFLAAAVAAVPVAARLGLGSVLGYLVAGVLIGPILGLVGHEAEEIQHVAEFGVVMMLFLIGLELEAAALWGMRRQLLGLGGLQIVLTAAAVAGAASLLGLGWSVAVAVGLVLALSSTAIVLQTLNEKGLTRTPGGRGIFSVLLTQDVAVIPMLAFLPLLALGFLAPPSEHEDGHGGMSLVEGLDPWAVALVTLGAVAAVILAGRYLVRPAFAFIDRSGLREMHTAFALLIVVGISTLMYAVGLSPALGAFLAGVVLASSEFRHELEADIEPFKGLLLGVFFITVGAGIDFGTLASAPLTILGLTLGLMALKAAILFGLALVFGLRRRDGWLFTLGLAQAGEFGFVLTAFGVQQMVLPGAVADRLLLVIALSMLLTPLAFLAYEAIARRMRGDASGPDEDEIDETGDIIIAGIGRFGQIVNRIAMMQGYKPVVIDTNLQTVNLMRRFGFRGFYGDPTRPDILAAAGLAEARVLVVALDDPQAALRLTAYARKARPDLTILARAYDRVAVYRLYRAGADRIVREMFDASVRTGRHLLEALGHTPGEATRAAQHFYDHDREMLKELALLWDPEIPIEKNGPYMARVHQMNAEMEAAIVTTIGERREAAE